MPYLNNHFHVYDAHKDISFQIIGKDNFIRFLNGAYFHNQDNFDRYKYFATYSELNEFSKLSKGESWRNYTYGQPLHKSKCIRLYIDKKKGKV